jgi:hypothetical protein
VSAAKVYRLPNCLASLSLFLMSVSLANGAELDLAKSIRERQLLESVSIGFAAGFLCGREMSDELMASSLRSGFGQRQFTAQEVSKIAKFIAAIHVAQQALYTLAPDKYCEHSRSSQPPGLAVQDMSD